MHDTSKIGSFMALRANGWSLAKISKELNISKSTLWEWDNKRQCEIHLLKHLQLEKLQEKFLPTYEEELSKLRGYLDRLETALENQDFSKMGPEYVLQMALQLRARLGKMREQVPLRNVPFNEPLTPLPFTGCVSRQNDLDFLKEYSVGESEDDAAPDDPHESSPEVIPPIQQADVGSSAPSESIPDSNGAIQAGQPYSDWDCNPSIQQSNHPLSGLRDSVVNPSGANRTFPDETPPGSKNEPLQINGFHKPESNGRPVLVSQNGSANGHANGNGRPHVNGNGHASGNGLAHSANDSENSLRELRDSVVNPTQAGPFVPDGWELTDHVSENGVRLAFPKRKRP